MRFLRAVTSSGDHRKRRSSGGEATSIYYASDVHGSERLWRKFLGASSFYGVDALVMGGDLTGKAIVPVWSNGDGHEAQFLGERRRAATAGELEELLGSIRFNGMYPWVTTKRELGVHTRDPARQEVLFDQIIQDEVRRWVELADKRLGGQSTPMYVMAGNDDPWFVDTILESAQHLRLCDDRVVMVGRHEMLSCSYANTTPWNSPRELDEDALYSRLRSLAEQLEHPHSAIFNVHVPPYDSGLDLATKIDGEFRVVLEGGAPTEIPVGSTAVREILEEYQPLVALHGHIHESRGETSVGRTLALNPGSEYGSGQIHGVVVRLAESSVSQHQFVIG